jgi:hypothetical protein
VLETIAEIARNERWLDDKATLQIIFDVFCDLQSMTVSGIPEKNMFCKSPFVFLLNVVAWIV